MDKEQLGTLLIFLTALGSGVAIIVNRFFVLKIDPVVFTALRALFIGLAFFLYSRFFVKKEQKKCSTPQLAVLGFIGGGLAFLLFFTGLGMTTGGRAAFIHKTLPVWAMIFAYLFLKEKITKKHAVPIVLALVGLSIMEFESIPTILKSGDMLVLLATILWALENTLAKHFMNLGETNWRISFGRMFFGSLFLFAIAALQGKLGLILALQPIQWLYVIISTMMLGWYVLTWYWGLKHISLSKATGILLISPVISLILGVLFLQEPVYSFQLVGSALILVGCYKLAKTRSAGVEIGEHA
ncbi:MAG: DMT family transporter [Candidatus Altiarchaeota archaeon]|nr:DMT family transporter [Candidatus Altiarchaeota archaeon]